MHANTAMAGCSSVFLDPASLGERELCTELRARGYTELSTDMEANVRTLHADVRVDPFARCPHAWEELALMRNALQNPSARNSTQKADFMHFAGVCKQHARAQRAAASSWLHPCPAWTAALCYLHRGNSSEIAIDSTAVNPRKRGLQAEACATTPVYTGPSAC